MSNKIISFIIPVRHHENAENWELTIKNLRETIASLINQTSNKWECIVVANENSLLPELDDRIRVHRVNFEKNQYHTRNSCDEELFFEAIREDKGKRVLRGLQESKESKYYMVLDDDDFVHKNIVKFIEENRTSTGWRIDKGYVWSEGGSVLIKYYPFYQLCGSSFIIRKDLVDFSIGLESRDLSYVKKIYGSHKYINEYLNEKELKLENIPFYAAIYRIGSGDNHSGLSGIFRNFIVNRNTIKSPKKIISRLKGLRVYSKSIKSDFTGK